MHITILALVSAILGCVSCIQSVQARGDTIATYYRFADGRLSDTCPCLDAARTLSPQFTGPSAPVAPGGQATAVIGVAVGPNKEPLGASSATSTTRPEQIVPGDPAAVYVNVVVFTSVSIAIQTNVGGVTTVPQTITFTTTISSLATGNLSSSIRNGGAGVRPNDLSSFPPTTSYSLFTSQTPSVSEMSTLSTSITQTSPTLVLITSASSDKEGSESRSSTASSASSETSAALSNFISSSSSMTRIVTETSMTTMTSLLQSDSSDMPESTTIVDATAFAIEIDTATAPVQFVPTVQITITPPTETTTTTTSPNANAVTVSTSKTTTTTTVVGTIVSTNVLSIYNSPSVLNTMKKRAVRTSTVTTSTETVVITVPGTTITPITTTTLSTATETDVTTDKAYSSTSTSIERSTSTVQNQAVKTVGSCSNALFQNYLSAPPTGVFYYQSYTYYDVATKVDCCNTCFEGTNCAFYVFFPGNTRYKCKIVFPDASSRAIAPPAQLQNACPRGISTIALSYNQDVGQAHTVEYGPCDSNTPYAPIS